jgi:hypothetical protein
MIERRSTSLIAAASRGSAARMTNEDFAGSAIGARISFLLQQQKPRTVDYFP